MIPVTKHLVEQQAICNDDAPERAQYFEKHNLLVILDANIKSQILELEAQKVDVEKQRLS